MNANLTESPNLWTFNPAMLQDPSLHVPSGSLGAALQADPQQAVQVHGRIDLATVLELLHG
jgi:hypothetical protein